MIPTLKEYEKAKKITIAYEVEQQRLHELKVIAFKEDLKVYFKNNLIDGLFELKEFELRGNNIIPIKPNMEEYYDEGNDEDIKNLCKKHGVNYSIIYWCYHK